MSTKKFYEALAPHYHLIFKDWDASMRRQGRQLKQLIRREAPKARLLLDRACGIGTQALPLAKLGFEVRGEDISPKAIRRARREAKARGLTAKFAVADMRRAPKAQRGAYDVVMACDNAIPHLLDDAQIMRAFKAARACLKPGGLYLASVRDYVKELKDPAFVKVRQNAKRPTDTLIWLQVWAMKGQRYDLGMHVVREPERGPATLTRAKAVYYAVSIATLLRLMRQAGFKKVRRIDGAFYQPMLLGRA